MQHYKEKIQVIYEYNARFIPELDSTRRKASEICLRPPLDIYSHTFSR